MSFARFGWDGSDVYLFPTSTEEGGSFYECCACPMGEYASPDAAFPRSFVTNSVLVYLDHIATHRDNGDVVPSYVEADVFEWEVLGI